MLFQISLVAALLLFSAHVSTAQTDTSTGTSPSNNTNSIDDWFADVLAQLLQYWFVLTARPETKVTADIFEIF
jgi:hypothetical protein